MRVLSNMNTRSLVALFVVSTIVVLAGCGGGGGSSSGATGGGNTGGGGGGGVTTSVISGVAAAGAPIAGKVTAVDKNGKVFSAVTSAVGAYTMDVTNGAAPFILTVVGTSGGREVMLNSVASAAGQTVNVTPLTDLIVSHASGQPGAFALGMLCSPSVAGAVDPACTTALATATTGTRLADAVTVVKGMVSQLNTGNVDPLNGAFNADGTGMDAVLDQIVMAPATAQGGQATVTLVAVPSASLGAVTLPATAGGTSTTVAGTATATDITNATSAQMALAEIRTCLASLSALFPAGMTTPPSAAQVGAFFDPAFSLNSKINYAGLTTFLSTMPTAKAGTNGGFAVPGLTFTAPGFSQFDFTRQAGANLLNTTSPFAGTAAWIQLNGSGTTNFGFSNWKAVKGAAYTGCPGGWRLLGNDRFEMQMQARIAKNNFGSVAYKRSLSMHIPTAVSDVQSIAKVEVRRPAGLGTYGGSALTPLGAVAPVTLLPAPAVVAPAVRNATMGVVDPTGFYMAGGDEIQSCQELAAIPAGSIPMPAVGTPCYDETVTGPSAIFKVSVFLTTNATATPDFSFPFQVSAVPLPRSFIVANDKDLFAQNLAATPAGTAALNTAAGPFAVGAQMNGVISFTYTNSLVYGTQTNHCGITVTDANNVVILRAEQNADALPTQQTACTFDNAPDANGNTGLNSGSLAKPASAFGGAQSYMLVGNMVLGNQAVSAKPY